MDRNGRTYNNSKQFSSSKSFVPKLLSNKQSVIPNPNFTVKNRDSLNQQLEHRIAKTALWHFKPNWGIIRIDTSHHKRHEYNPPSSIS